MSFFRCLSPHDQDLVIPLNVIWHQWRTRKMSDMDCLKDLVRCRDRGAMNAIQVLEALVKRQRMIDLEKEMERVQKLIESGLKAFIEHPIVVKFREQVHPQNYGKVSRLQCLLMVGDSRQGKSNKGMSIFGVKHTLKVGCQGLPPGVLPSISRLNRDVHKAILWDEVRPDQILSNREIFQSNQWEQWMSQSSCNQHAYSVWLYFIPMILSTNDFDMSSLSPADKEWLQSNLLVASLAPGQRWYLDS